jgi:ubiquinone biosynthesis protein COQ9
MFSRLNHCSYVKHIIATMRASVSSFGYIMSKLVRLSDTCEPLSRTPAKIEDAVARATVA